MSQMVRKQIYLYKQQETMLRRVAEARGVSEAEVIRQALGQALSAEAALLSEKSPLDEFIELARSKKKGSDKPYKWSREDAYDDERSQKLMGRLATHDKPDTD